MALEILKLSEVSQKENDKYHMIITYLWNLKYGTDEPIYKTETDHVQEEQTFGSQWGEGRVWGGWEVWDVWM